MALRAAPGNQSGLGLTRVATSDGRVAAICSEMARNGSGCSRGCGDSEQHPGAIADNVEGFLALLGMAGYVGGRRIRRSRARW